MNELAKTSNDELKKVIKESINPDMSDAEFAYFFEFCKRRNLDPLTDVYPVSRWDSRLNKKRTTFQASIDAYRKIAVRSNDYAGSLIEWCGEDGVWKDVWLSKTPPSAAKCTVKRKSSTTPTSRVVLFDEYVQKTKDGKPTDFWNRMPATMLAKCAESLALRATFPEELGGIYTKEEMMQADNIEYIEISNTQPTSLPPPQPTQKPQYSTPALEKLAEFRQFADEEMLAKFEAWFAKNPDEVTLVKTLMSGLEKIAVKAETLAIMITNSDMALVDLMKTFSTYENRLLEHPKVKEVVNARQ